MKHTRSLSCFILLLALGACANRPPSTGGWIMEGVSTQETAQDYTACRREADRVVGRYAGYDDALEKSSNPLREAERAGVRARFDSYVSDCMMGKGYLRGKPGR
jgi:hypothetical protein